MEFEHKANFRSAEVVIASHCGRGQREAAATESSDAGNATEKDSTCRNP